MIAKVAVSKALYAIDKPYDYLVPDALTDRVQVGMRVLVPFGRGNRTCDALVLACADHSSRNNKLKQIITVLDDEPVLSPSMVRLALWMRERYFCTVYDAIKAMLPAGLYFSLRDCCCIADTVSREDAYATAEGNHDAHRLLEILFRHAGRADMEVIRTAFGHRSPSGAIRFLSDKHIIEIKTEAEQAVKDKTQQIAVLTLPAEEAMSLIASKQKSAPVQHSVVELLCAMGSASIKELCYFTGATSATFRALEKKGILAIEHQQVFRSDNLYLDVEEADEIVLNQEQEAAFRRLDALADGTRADAALLYGVTGSGKTQVYIKLIKQVLSRGRTAMVLVPEIALTPQLLRVFSSHFGRSIAVLHSSLRSGERYDEWKRVKNGQAKVVIGTRSAVFAPLPDLGVIILDEEQESSYKSENTPRYHARDIAKYRCAQDKALLVLGSATPSVETMYHARTGSYHMIKLLQRYNRLALPEVLITDMKEELRAGNDTSISLPLADEIRRNLDRGEQTILFLNRRGASRMVSCGECGHVPECVRCSAKLTFHSVNQRLMCHYCGHSQPVYDACPECGGALYQIGIGTQKVQQELEVLFPDVPVLRMDTDTVSSAHPHQYHLDRFRDEKIPILIGTQMVAKGLDFENVTLVGVLCADQSLYVEDFRAGERTFSLLTQVVGRAGRGGKTGRAVIQTFTPEHDVIVNASRQDYDSFYEQEIQLRKLRGSPPFRDITVITVSGPEETEVERICYKVRSALEYELKKIADAARVLGPAPAVVAKVNNRYRYRITLEGKSTPEQRRIISGLLCAVHQDKSCTQVSAFADINPMD